MTVAELIEKLKEYDPKMVVLVEGYRIDSDYIKPICVPVSGVTYLLIKSGL